MAETKPGQTEIALSLWEEYRSAKRSVDTYKAVLEEISERIKKELGTATIGTVNGEPVIEAKKVEGMRFSTKRFQQDYPDIYEAYRIPYDYVRLSFVRNRGRS